MKKMNKRITKKAGFTLVEVMIAILVLGIVSAATLQAIRFSHGLSIDSRSRITAMHHAKTILDKVKITNFENLPLGTWAPEQLWIGGIKNDLSVVTDANGNALYDLPGETISIVITNAPDGGTRLRQITVAVTWTGAFNVPHTSSFTTYKSRLKG
jgi:prepilin-type N-terminal cleavage/methylation domain-containing protein